MHYNRNSFLFVNAAKRYQFKANDSEIKNISSVKGIFQRISKLLTWKKTGLNECACDFAVYNRAVDTTTITITIIITFDNIINAHKYLIKKHDIK